MKKKFLFIPLASIVLLATPVGVFAEDDITESTSDVVDDGEVVSTEEATNNEVVENVDEEVSATLKEQALDFSNKWLVPILALVGGTSGTGLGFLCLLKFFKDLNENLKKEKENAKKETADTRDVLNATVKTLEQTREEMTTTIAQAKDDFLALKTAYEEDSKAKGKVIDDLTSSLSAAKLIMCQLVSMNPDLIAKGDAQKLIELCDETFLKVEGVEGNE